MSTTETRAAARRRPDLVVGWGEWVALPELGLLAVRAKIDTGARTSALHACDVSTYRRGEEWRARFTVHPLPRRRVAVACDARLVDERDVTSSSGHTETRLVVATRMRLGVKAGAPEWPIELTLTDRGEMRFRMLVGRQALAGRALVHPAAAYLHGRVSDAAAFYA